MYRTHPLPGICTDAMACDNRGVDRLPLPWHRKGMKAATATGTRTIRTVAALLLLALWVRAAIPVGYMPVPSADRDGWLSFGFCGARLGKPLPAKLAFSHGGEACLFAPASALVPLDGIGIPTPHSLFIVVGQMLWAPLLVAPAALRLPPARGPPMAVT